MLIVIFFIPAQGCGSWWSPDAPDKPVLSAGGESITVSWNAVAGAARYNLYYTDDYTEPVAELSGSVAGITACVYTHNQLNPVKSYRYAVQAVDTSGNASPLSAASVPLKPNPCLTVNVVIPDYPNKAAVILLLDVPYEPLQDIVTGTVVIVDTITCLTDELGYVSIRYAVDHEKYWGFTVIKDMDASGTLTVNDEVWGNGAAGEFGYKAYTSHLGSSVLWSSDNWETAAGGYHTY